MLEPGTILNTDKFKDEDGVNSNVDQSDLKYIEPIKIIFTDNAIFE